MVNNRTWNAILFPAVIIFILLYVLMFGERNQIKTVDRSREAHRLVVDKPSTVINTVAKPLPTETQVTNSTQNITNTKSPKAMAGTFQLVREENPEFSGLSISSAMAKIHEHVRTMTAVCNKTRRFGRPGDGGYMACMDPPYAPEKDNCLVYSFGIRNEWSFDDAMYKEMGCEVHAFDPSMKQQDHMHSAGVRFHRLGLWGSDVVNDEGWNLMTLGTIISFLGHKNRVIDYLKIDIEGAEWPALQEMLATLSTKNVKQMIFEIHTPKFKETNMNLKDFGQVDLDLKAIQDVLGFRLYKEGHTNGCCGRFATLTMLNKRPHCCYELFYVNSNFDKTI